MTSLLTAINYLKSSGGLTAQNGIICLKQVSLLKTSDGLGTIMAGPSENCCKGAGGFDNAIAVHAACSSLV